MDNERKQKLALKFLSILGKPDAGVVKEVTVEDVVWTFPGHKPDLRRGPRSRSNHETRQHHRFL